MSYNWLPAIFLMFFSLAGNSQNRQLKGDYSGAVNLNINQKYVFKTAAVGFGKQQEYPKKKEKPA